MLCPDPRSTDLEGGGPDRSAPTAPGASGRAAPPELAHPWLRPLSPSPPAAPRRIPRCLLGRDAATVRAMRARLEVLDSALPFGSPRRTNLVPELAVPVERHVHVRGDLSGHRPPSESARNSAIRSQRFGPALSRPMSIPHRRPSFAAKAGEGVRGGSESCSSSGSFVPRTSRARPTSTFYTAVDAGVPAREASRAVPQDGITFPEPHRSTGYDPAPESLRAWPEERSAPYVPGKPAAAKPSNGPAPFGNRWRPHRPTRRTRTNRTRIGYGSDLSSSTAPTWTR